jgi:bacillithiol system protein YtxJ
MFNVMYTSQDFEAALAASHEKPIVIFKHSATCPFSAAAQVEVANAKHDIDIYGIVLQYTEGLKTEIAEKLNVEHQSPQTIVVHKGQAVSHQWRDEIQKDRLIQEVANL